MDTLTQQIEKMNLEQLDVQVQLIETRRAAENDSELHKEQTAKVGARMQCQHTLCN